MISWSSVIVVFGILLQYVVVAQKSVMTFSNRVEVPEFADPDNYGYRYCAYWKLANGVRLWSDCDPFVMNRCGVKLQFEYRCCPQFRAVREDIFPLNPSGKRKCAGVLPQWDFCPNVLSKIVGYRAFGELLRFGDFTNEKTTATYTIFAPYTRNEMAIDQLFGKYKDRQSSSPVTHHVVKNRIYAKDLRDGMQLETIYGTKLKVTKYSYGVTCVECVELIDADFECRNGVIHMISKPLVSPKGMAFDRENLYTALSSDPRTKSFANDLSSELQDELRQVDSGTWYTVFAPTEEQWLKIRAEYPDAAVREKIASNHFVRKMHCSAAIIRHTANILTIGGEYLTAECDSEKDTVTTKMIEIRYVKNFCGVRRRFIESDITAGNGVIHVIDGALIPISVRSFKSLLECGDDLGFKRYTEWVKDCDLRMEEGKKYAVLIPMDYSFDWWKDYAKFKPEYDRYQTDAEYRCRVARYHIVAYNDPLQRLIYLWHEQSGYQTNNIDMRHEVDYFLKNQYKSELYFHYSPVVNFEAIEFSQGSFYRLQRINVIPELFMIDVLKSRADLNLTYEKVVQIDFDTTVFKKHRPLNLYLATINKKWKQDGDNEWVEEYEWPIETTTNLFLLHTVPLYLWGGDIGYFKPNTVHKFMSRLGIELTFQYSADLKMRIGHNETDDGSWSWANVIEFNLHAIDGMIWLLDGIIKCPQKYCNTNIVEFELYDIYMAACTIKEFGDPPIDMEREFKATPYEFALNHTATTCYVNHLATYQALKPIDDKKKKKKY